MQTFSERINTNQASITSDHVDIPSAQELVGFLADKKKKNLLRKTYATRVAQIFKALQILPMIHFELVVTMAMIMAWGATHGNMPNVLGW